VHVSDAGRPLRRQADTADAPVVAASTDRSPGHRRYPRTVTP
jgi:hypothetical protein